MGGQGWGHPSETAVHVRIKELLRVGKASLCKSRGVWSSDPVMDIGKGAPKGEMEGGTSGEAGKGHRCQRHTKTSCDNLGNVVGSNLRAARASKGLPHWCDQIWALHSPGGVSRMRGRQGDPSAGHCSHPGNAGV